MLLANGHRIHIHAVPEPPLTVGNRHVVAAHLPLPHPPVRRKRPVLQAVAAVPRLHSTNVYIVLIPKLHGNAVVRKGKEFLAQPVAVLAGPLALEKLDDGLVALEKGVAVAPDAVLRVRRGDNRGVSMTLEDEQEEHVERDRTHFVFQASWAALTFFSAVSRVNGGNGGRPVVGVVDVIVGAVNWVCQLGMSEELADFNTPKLARANLHIYAIFTYCLPPSESSR